MPITDAKKKWIDAHQEQHKLTSQTYSLNYYYNNRDKVLEKQRQYYLRKKTQRLQAEGTNKQVN